MSDRLTAAGSVSVSSLHDAKERVRQVIDIVELVGSYVQLRREGRNYKAICPWHDDTRPSLQVNPERQSFKCWVCDLGGDIFNFIMKMENVEFPEALKMLAERAGIQLKPSRPGAGKSSGDEKQVLYQAMSWAEEQFHRCLMDAPEAEPARRYLAERKISPESIRKYRLGYAPDRWDWLIQRALNSEITAKLLETVGLVVRKQDSPGVYDRFRGRVLFPIRDVQGRSVATGGRILPHLANDNPAKYINSPETPLFSKSSMLYGLDSARDAIGKSRVAVVMEGYTDTIVARQFGFDNTVAVLGTALGDRHIRLLRRFADSITLVLDGDEAGQRRANEVLGLFIAEQVDLRIVTLPDNLDPADFLLERGAESFRQFLDSAVDALEHKLAAWQRKIGPRPTTHDANRVIEDMLGTLARAPRPQSSTPTQVRLREHQMLARMSRQFGLAEEMLRERLRDLRQRAKRPESSGEAEIAAEARPQDQPLSPLDRELLEIILLDPQSVAEFAKEIRAGEIQSATARQVFDHCCELHLAGIAPDFDRLMLDFDDPVIKNMLVDVDECAADKAAREQTAEEQADEDDLIKMKRPARVPLDIDGWRSALIKRIQHRDNSRRLSATVQSLKQDKHEPQDELELLNQIIAQERTRQGITLPTEG
ncbi:MAG: DNA primase [Pirellulales bacterium]|nr:DNA primase [Pirellulales bacterium]